MNSWSYNHARNNLKNENFIHTMQKHCYEVISHLIEENIEFSIVANTKFHRF